MDDLQANSLLVTLFLNELLKFICMHIVRGFKYFHLAQIILFNINHLFAHSYILLSSLILL